MPVMLKALAMAGASISLASAAPMNGTMNSGMPPLRYQGNGAAVVIFTDRAGIDEACGVAPEGFRIIACTKHTSDGVGVIFMPNPAPYGETEFFARIMSHELGHVNGWSGNHEQ
jgi:hypothetical protein